MLTCGFHNLMTHNVNRGRYAEAYGEDPTLVAEMGVAATHGLQGLGSQPSQSQAAGAGAAPTGTYIAEPTLHL